jgi:uncharacterized protein YndB with AHSA1/START domain
MTLNNKTSPTLNKKIRMKKENDIAAMDKLKTVKIKRVFDLPIATIWKAWSEPESFKKWWGPENYSCPYCSIDFKVGGKCLASMKGPDEKEIWAILEYREIILLKKIVYADNFSDNLGNIVPPSDYGMPGEWPAELLVTVEFEEVGETTVMNMQQAGLPPEVYEDCIKGWQSCFDKMETIR